LGIVAHLGKLEEDGSYMVHNIFVRESTESPADAGGCALAGIVGSNPAGAMDFCVL
jgi:hypothetical protein